MHHSVVNMVASNNCSVAHTHRSQVVEMLLIRAQNTGRKFRVIVADSRPKLEGMHRVVPI
jgi:translation initiation factor 2B subunit (eIF-2B alpha/beta/delta family)